MRVSLQVWHRERVEACAYNRAHVLDACADVSFIAFLREHGVRDIALLREAGYVTVYWTDGTPTVPSIDVSDFPSYIAPWVVGAGVQRT